MEVSRGGEIRPRRNLAGSRSVPRGCGRRRAPHRRGGGALGDPDWQVRAEAAVALARVRDARAILPLVGALGDTRWQVVKAAATALGAQHALGAAPTLVQLLSSLVPDVRRAAATALGDMNAKVAIEPLKRLAGDADVEVKKAASRARPSARSRDRREGFRTIVAIKCEGLNRI